MLCRFSLFLLGFFGWLLVPVNVSAPFLSTFSEGHHALSNNVAQTWNEPKHYDLYVLAITWHTRFAYGKEKTDKYSKRPQGMDFGVSRWDEKGNQHGLYPMAFKDSFNKWESIGDYSWKRTWCPLADQNFHLGLGYTLGVTACDNWGYIPVSVILPLTSIGYGPAAFQMIYIPGTYNNGNVCFVWARIQF